MPSPFLYFAGDRLSGAELSAARLDGHLVELGEGYIPADAVETRALRAASLTGLLGASLAATHLSAAWVHGALPAPPARHTVQRAVPRRLHTVIDRRLIYRDLQVADADLLRIGGVRVTSPERTLADLSRIADDTYTRAALLLAATDVSLPGRAARWLEQHRSLPMKRSALAFLRGLAAKAQEEVTR
ncbi:type IV toxin-antitoxin system AbiEi family antitoxin [Microbacterium sp. CJ88]|uniref:type IV toxin-antitoxin system AbiEi family antitoxin n=1 Tax=Microbacterium sp. CJ88 TaxID=3445672 RepID=UPI003F658E19